MTPKLSASVVGGGNGGKAGLAALQTSDRFDLVATADLQPAVCAALTTQFPGIQTFTSHDAMFAACPTDIVCVSTFPPSHETVAMDALKLPLKGILVEKPLGHTAASGRRILSATRARNLPLAVPHGLLVSKTPLDIIARVHRGEIGELKLVEIQNTNWDVINAGIHWLNFFVHLANNEPLAYVMAPCEASTRTYRDAMQVETTAVTYAQTISGIRVVMNTGDDVLINQPGKNTLFRLIGTKEQIEFWGWEPGYHIINSEFPAGELIIPEEVGPSRHQRHLETMADMVDSGNLDCYSRKLHVGLGNLRRGLYLQPASLQSDLSGRCLRATPRTRLEPRRTLQRFRWRTRWEKVVVDQLAKDQITLGMIGGGWRADFFLRIAQALPERFHLGGMLVRDAAKGERIEETWGVKTVRTLDELRRLADFQFVVVSVPWPVTPTMLRQLTERGIPALAETPPAPDLAGLIALHDPTKQGAKIQVAEQYQFQPLHAARLTLARTGTLGAVTQAQVSAAHGYHGVNLLRGLLEVDFEEVVITARSFTSSIVSGPGRGGPPSEEKLVASKQVIAQFDFGDKLGIFDFSGDQYFSWIRSSRLLVRGDRGEINNRQVRYLQDFRTPIDMELKRIDAGQNGNLEGYYHQGIVAGSDWIYRNPFVPARLTDDEIAIATCLQKMSAYVRGGPSFCGLPEASQDHYLSLMIDEAVRSGEAVTTQQAGVGIVIFIAARHLLAQHLLGASHRLRNVRGTWEVRLQ